MPCPSPITIAEIWEEIFLLQTSDEAQNAQDFSGSAPSVSLYRRYTFPLQSLCFLEGLLKRNPRLQSSLKQQRVDKGRGQQRGI